MIDLLYKEYKLFWHSYALVYLLFGALLLIPSWPYFVALSYIIWIGFSTAFFTGRSNQDIFFSVSLPVRKKDTVLARVSSVAIMEILQIIAAIPFAVINYAVYHNDNTAGMNPNFAFFGFIFIMYAIFNIIYLPGFYKTAYNVGKPMIIAITASLVFAAIFNVAVMLVPVLRTNLNGLGADHLAGQLTVLFTGIALFTGLTWLSYKISAKRFDKVDL